MAKSKIYIKPSKRGSLRKHLNVKRGSKIPANRLRIKAGDSPAIRKKKQFAINARKWNKQDGGMLYLPTNLPQESLGGVLGSMAMGAGSGAMVGAIPGAIIGGATGLIKGLFGHRQEKLAKEAEGAQLAEQQKLFSQMTQQRDELAEQDRRDMQIQGKINAMPQAPVYAPVVAKGGLISYNGPSHVNNPQGGIPVDSQGNPIKVTKQNPVALVEGGELARYQPDGGVFIFSKKSGHADKAKKIQKNFQKALGEDLNGVDKMAREAMNLRLDSLSEEQELEKLKGGGKMKYATGGELPGYVNGGPYYPYSYTSNNIPSSASQFSLSNITAPSNLWQTQPGRANFGDISSSNYNMFQGTSQQPTVNQGGQTLQPISYQPALNPMSTAGVTPQVTSAYANYDAGQGPLQTQNENAQNETLRLNIKKPWNYFQLRMEEAKREIEAARQIKYPDWAHDWKKEDPSGSEEKSGFNFGSLLSPVGHILSGIATNRDYNRLKREGPVEFDLGPDVKPAQAIAEQVSFAPERAIAREQAATGSAVAARTARNLGLSGSQAAASIGTSRLGVQRVLGQQLGTSIQRESVTNAQMRQQTGLANLQAKQQARLTNAQIRAQEGAYNATLRNQYRDRLRQLDPLSNWLRIGASYLGDNVSYGMDQQARELYAPNAEFGQPKWWEWALGQKGKVSYKGPPLKT